MTQQPTHAEILQRFSEALRAAEAVADPELFEALRRRLEAARTKACEALASQAGEPTGRPPARSWHGMIGSCESIMALRTQAQKFADADVPVLIRGESGTGKDVVAQILHRIGPRAACPFVSENCAAIPSNLLESILFGHKKGSFTGAIKDHDGHFVAADHGTLFLDEIGDMPLPMQAKMLRVLQEGEVRAVGSTRVQKVDVRIIAATNQDLEAMVARKEFREDLYYRLNVLQIHLPPLRERGDDVIDLAHSFLAAATASSGRHLKFEEDAVAALRAGRWRGNVRQLQNEMQRVAVLAVGDRVTAADLSAEI